MASPIHLPDIERAARLVDEADCLVIAAGAGMGIDSGLPDFRGQHGFWRAYPALGRHGIAFTAIASPRAFHRDPRLAWGFYGHRLALYRDTVPHPGFALLRDWSRDLPAGCVVFTSNVDGQFQRAGFGEDIVTECHGSLHFLQCLEPCCDAIWPADGFVPDVDDERCVLRNALPACPHCGGIARPNVLMFGDADWIEARTAAQARRLERQLQRASRPVVIEIGAGQAVPTVRHFSEQLAFDGGVPVIRINPREPGIHGLSTGVSLPLGALEALRAIESARGN
ncbi:NAD-dependent deacetylase [Pigmentiphaga sp. NML080357]|uniref:SIR2 family NAD-dependent protein deacylase n=1 Tax=Pigmentiphaga sp. NML080357 TaxID=2008675 RepID=UPI000B417025|nr:Sir2 family NAD-dependent protein deacetylase [Pigmentiphaga sp. NML080357]OVZ55892.1 NAD-dependent deacetylase [Pigmentiphaga sp. NML080357]